MFSNTSNFHDYLLYDNLWSIENIITFLFKNKIKLSNRIYEDIIFTQTEKEIFKIKKRDTGQKTVEYNIEDKNFILNVFKEDIKIHNKVVNNLLNSIGNSTNNVKNNIVTSNILNTNQEKINSVNNSNLEDEIKDDINKKKDL